MHPHSRIAVLATLATLATAATAHAHPADLLAADSHAGHAHAKTDAHAGHAHAKAEAKPTGVKADMLFWIEDAESKLMELASVTPADKFGWRPADDVRSTAEVYMHVAGANYAIPASWGVEPPAGFNMMTYEKSLTSKADVSKALAESFTHLKTALASASDADLDKEIAIFFGMMKMPARRAYMLLLSHAHEHLGQSIAYARSNGIAPPWTARQNAQFQEMMQKQQAKSAGDK